MVTSGYCSRTDATKAEPSTTVATDTSVAASSISSDNAQGSLLAAQTMATLTNGKNGSVLVLDTKAGTSTTDARAKGFETELKKSSPNLKSIGILHFWTSGAERPRWVWGRSGDRPR
jgi:ABC-type sugar transport system substrate-binding protein